MLTTVPFFKSILIGCFINDNYDKIINYNKQATKL